MIQVIAKHISSSPKWADASAAGSAFLAGASWIAELNAFVQLGATAAALLAGFAAAWYHIERARALRASRLKKEEK